MIPGISPCRDLTGICAPHPPTPHTDPALKDSSRSARTPRGPTQWQSVPVTCWGILWWDREEPQLGFDNNNQILQQ